MSKKWLSATLSFTLMFGLVPIAFAQGGQASQKIEAGPSYHKQQPKKKAKANGKVTIVDATAGKVTVESKGNTVELNVTADTKIKIEGMKNATLSDIWTGDQAEGEYTTENEVNTAKSITVKKQKGSVKGKVEAVDNASGSITIAGTQVYIGATAVITIGKEKATIEEIEAGDTAEVKGFKKEGNLQALTVQIKRDSDKGHKNGEVEGKVEAIDASSMSLTVKGKKVQVTETTVITGEDRKVLAFADLKVGAKLEAKGTWEKNVLKASKIKVEKNNENGNKDDGKEKKGEVEGKVDAIDSAAKTLSMKGKKVLITDTTVISGEKNKKQTIESIQVGDKVEAKGIWKEDVLVATNVKVESKGKGKNDK